MVNLPINFQKIMNRKSVRAGTIAGALFTVLSPFYPIQHTNAAPFDQQDQGAVTIDDIVDNPEAYEGRIVTLRSEPEAAVDPYAFRLDDEDGIGIFGLDFDEDEILVLNVSGVPFALPIDDDLEIQVTGEVRSFVRTEVERELDIDLDPDFYIEYENQPVIYAQSIALAPEPDEVTDNPELFYGQPIAVEGEVDKIYGPNAFTLHDEEPFDGEDLLVVNAPEAVKDGDNVVIVGEIRSLSVADLERDFSLDWDNLEIQSEAETEYEQRPVLVVREIYPLSQ